MDAPSLPDPLKAFAQIFMARKVLSHTEAEKVLENCYKRFPGNEMDVSPAISKVDATLSCIDMGIRSMKALGPDGMIYHCLVNKTADEVAKLYGSRLTEWQVEAFKAIIAMFGETVEEQIHLRDLENGLRPKLKNVTNEMIRTFADHLVEDFWLSRPQNRVGYRLGVRTYVELPELLKSYDLDVSQVIHH